MPIIALTATATTRVKDDIVANLGMRDVRLVSQFFNRQNLRYEVRAKTPQVLDDVAAFISNGYEEQCGIIYCYSQNQCETTAKRLRIEFGFRATHYHAVSNVSAVGRAGSGLAHL